LVVKEIKDESLVSLYDEIVKTNPEIDANQVYLFAGSAATGLTSMLINDDTNMWKGAILSGISHLS
jgi:hypothetical protein